jgi:hypothetical protein
MERGMHASLISVLAAGAAALLAVSGMAAPSLAPWLADNNAAAIPVDVELVLAVDVSYSMDPEEQALQREGYIAGITINGLPIMLKRPNAFTMDIDNLDIYFEDCVIGGPGAFVIPIREREQFKEAIRTKLVLEIAGPLPQRGLVPAQARAPRISCTIGEQMWRERWGN